MEKKKRVSNFVSWKKDDNGIKLFLFDTKIN